ncbi:alpha/beta hydrolase [Methanosarcina sp. KYL-1]|uniref:alpha/beta fold hydrolase n=1 Tax=Methanosarcina sp. KYL-1 TaxID=2602068 RepID=UPI0021013858|nr:alpha/beta hydrolase [Methanosarcina sp. KYL-1]MCQ1534770.1 alpha/beta hydrolase [Methanosarcina sp. KYL-1]
MKHLRKYGSPPFDIAVIHGGPGAPGEMAPVARELSSIDSCVSSSYARGVLEPLQTETTLEGQVRELKTVLEEHGILPVTLIGFSWGAMLSYIFTARRPEFVKKLILVGSGPYEEKYAANIMQTRISRLSKAEKEEVFSLMEILDGLSPEKKNASLARFGELISRADSYDPLPHPDEVLECRYDIHKGVWEEASELRSSGKLLEPGTKISCPVVAIHGDYDPHPFEGVREPLSRVLKDFRFILLEKCGHRPWVERQAKERFYDVLKGEI